MAKGGRANKRGRTFENAVSDLLRDEYQEVSTAHFFALTEINQPVFTHQFHIGKDLYGKKRRVDFLLYHPVRWPNCLAIQCKWQASSGSVEEKYPFEVLSIQLNTIQTIIVLDGNGYSKGAAEWLKQQAGKGYLLHVFNLGEITNFQSQGRI